MGAVGPTGALVWHVNGAVFVLSSMQYDDGQSLSVLQLCAPWQTAASRLGVVGS